MVKRLNDECQTPPDGWVCVRSKGHEGPCAAYQVEAAAVRGVGDEPPAGVAYASGSTVERIAYLEALLDEHRNAESALWAIINAQRQTIANQAAALAKSATGQNSPCPDLKG